MDYEFILHVIHTGHVLLQNTGRGIPVLKCKRTLFIFLEFSNRASIIHLVLQTLGIQVSSSQLHFICLQGRDSIFYIALDICWIQLRIFFFFPSTSSNTHPLAGTLKCDLILSFAITTESEWFLGLKSALLNTKCRDAKMTTLRSDIKTYNLFSSCNAWLISSYCPESQSLELKDKYYSISYWIKYIISQVMETDWLNKF